MLVLILFVAFALGVSFLCSLLEAALLSARTARLIEKRAAGVIGAGLLLTLKQSRLDDAISAVLILNTIANTLGATLAGAQAAQVFGRTWVGVFSGLLTFVILIVSEIIPKTLGAVYSTQLSGMVGWTLTGLVKLMSPALFLSRVITRLLARGGGASLSRSELATVISMATREGVLSPEESRMFANLLRFDSIQVEDVMTPRTVTFMLPADATIADLLAEAEARFFSRIPLFRPDRDHVVGYVLQRDVLKAVAEHCDREQPLERFMRPISHIPELASVGAALRRILKQREPIAVVTDEHGGVAGLVTLEDLTETILGTEIVDESDQVADMRVSATKLRDQRLERIRKMRQPATTGENDG
ncbi:MAG TPA: hemolysin family protein [Candidatus Polarisedimenticolaceae bacterium]|nr:hemolysin family protein [Candidatus Polarisedimenticolaceae bacterium]